MRRSFKKYPIVVQEKDDRKYLNRKIRRNRYMEFSTPGAYRKISCWDWKYIWTKEDAINLWKNSSKLREKYTLDEYIEFWKKETIRK